MLSRPSRLQTLLLMLPPWAFAHAVLLLRVIPAEEGFGRNFLFGRESAPYLYAIAAIAALFASFVAARRARALGWTLPPVLGLLLHVPFLGGGLALWLAATGEGDEKTSATPAAVAGRLTMPLLFAGGGALLLAIGIEQLEQLDLMPFGVREVGGYFGMATFIGLPFAAGASAAVVIRRAGGTFGQAVAASLTLMGAVLLILCSLFIEGIICVLMAAPFGALLAFLGCAAGFLLVRSAAGGARLQSAAWLGVVALVGVEGWQAPAPREDSASSEVLIDASPERVWSHLHTLGDLPRAEQFLFRYGVAHPLATRTDGQGVGAARLCVLSTGEMPEIVTVWKPAEELRFKVLSTPPAMRETGFFGREIDASHLCRTYASLEGGFRLIRRPDGKTLLIGESRYLLNLAPTGYWNLWTQAIVRQVQLRVMEHVKALAEAGPEA